LRYATAVEKGGLEVSFSDLACFVKDKRFTIGGELLVQLDIQGASPQLRNQGINPLHSHGEGQ